MADKEALTEQFVGVTGVDADRARFHLESAAWNLELAMASYYDGDGDGVGDDEAETSTSASAVGRLQEAGQQTGSSGSRFATLSSVKHDDEVDPDEGQAFYAGGSERSGQQVLGPPKKKVDPDEMVDILFKSAKEHGAEIVESNEKQGRSGPSFRGAGYRLGDTEEKSDVVPGTHIEEPRQVDMVLKLWKNGFSMDEGPQRDYNDPSNKEFLDSISKGEVPRELIRLAKGGEVNLNMEDHRNEEYIKPKLAPKAFSGEGHMLGSPAPGLVSKPSGGAGTSTASQNQTQQSSISIDESKPTTTLQIRLADGSRMVAKFNHCHRVTDIRNYITSSRPQYAAASFVLMTTFPNKELTDESITIEDAQLLNAVIVQRQK